MNNTKAKIRITLWILATIAIIGGIVVLSIGGSREREQSVNNLMIVAADDYVEGNPTARATLIEYLDFECEACGAYYPLIKQLSKELPDDLQIVSRYFPLPGHKNGLLAALAVEAAARQGKYWEMHDKLFENQKDWGERQAPDPTIFERYAQDIGLDIEKFKNDVNSQAVKDRVERDRKSAITLKLQGTPSFFLNGQKIQNPRGYDEFKQLIRAKINKTNQ